MKTNTLKKALSLLLCLAMCFSMVSVSAFAAETDNGAEMSTENEELSVTYEINPYLTENFTLGNDFKVHNLTYDASNTSKQNVQIVNYDADGYNRIVLYNVSYKDADGNAQNATSITYKNMREIIDNESNSECEVTYVTSGQYGNGVGYKENPVSAQMGSKFHSNAYNFHITGSAWDGVYDIETARCWANRISESDTASNGIGAGKANDFKTFMSSDENYMYKYTANKDVTWYVATFSNKTDHKKFLADGWKLIVSTPDINEVKKENYVEDYQKFFNDNGEFVLTDAITKKAVAKQWYMVEADYNPEKYPYAVKKIQYDAGSATYVDNFDYVWYKETKANETVEIPCPGQWSQSAPKVLLRVGPHLSDDLTGTISSLNGISATSRDSEDYYVKLDESKTVTFTPNDSSASYAFSETEDFSNEQQSYTYTGETEPKTIYLKITAAAGNSVVHKVHLSTALANGTLTVGQKTLELKDIKTRYYLSGVSVGDSISFVPADNAEATVSETKVTSLPSSVEVSVNVKGGRSWTYEVVLSEAELYQITNISSKGSSTKAVAVNAYEAKPKTITYVERAIIEERYGKIDRNDAEFWAGTDAYVAYPSIDSNNKIDSPAPVRISNTSAKFLQGTAFLFGDNKGPNNNTAWYQGGEGKYDGTDGNYYLTFNVNKPGTMYVFDTEGKDYPNGAKNGYTLVSGLKFADNSKAYAKHFDAGTVTVPSYGWSDSWKAKDSDIRTFWNSSYFVFVFDSDSDAGIKSVSYSGAASGTFEITENQTEIKAELNSSVNGEIEITPVVNSENATINPETIKVNVTNGAGQTTFVVTSPDGLAKKTYTVTFTARAAKKIYDATKGFGQPWINGLYGNNSSNPGNFQAIDYIPAAGETYLYVSYRTDIKGSAQAEFSGSTYIRMPKNEGTCYTEQEIQQDSTYTVQTGDNNPVTYTYAKSGYNGAGAGKVRFYNGETGIPQFFAGKYDGTDGKWYVTFKVSSDCRVFIADAINEKYPNLNKTEWTKSDLNYINKTTYYKDFKAGDTVCIPNYGMTDRLNDATPVTIKYTAKDGTAKTVNSTVGQECVYWDGIYVAVCWEKEKGLTDLKVNNETVKDFDANKTTYDVELESETIPEITYTAEDGASVSVENSEFEKGKATSTITVKNAVYTKVYTINFKVKAKMVTFTLTAVNGTVEANSESVTSATKEYEFGSNVTLKAVKDENSEFLYWKDGVSDAIISTDEEITLTAASNRNILAVFKDINIESGYYVSFYANGRIVAEGLASAVKVPENPYVAGYTFSGWYNNGEKTDLTSQSDVTVDKDTRFTAGFELNDNTYTVTVNNKDLETKYKYNEKVTVTAPASENDGEFAYWMRDGKIVSYNETYSFYVSANTSLTAVFSSEPVEEDVVITMTDPIVIQDGNRIAFYSERNVPSKYTVKETGIILAKDANFTNPITSVANSKANKGQYTVRLKNVQEGSTWYAKAYVVYTDGSDNTQIKYSDTVFMNYIAN